MDIQKFAKLLDNREYLEEITKEEEQIAKDLGYVVVFGYSDDNTEFRGAIDEELSSWGGNIFYLEEDGLLQCDCDDSCKCKYYKRAKENSVELKAIWSKGGYSWHYEIGIPHAEFDVLDSGDKYCRGIVFDVKSLKK